MWKTFFPWTQSMNLAFGLASHFFSGCAYFLFEKSSSYISDWRNRRWQTEAGSVHVYESYFALWLIWCHSCQIVFGLACNDKWFHLPPFPTVGPTTPPPDGLPFPALSPIRQYRPALPHFLASFRANIPPNSPSTAYSCVLLTYFCLILLCGFLFLIACLQFHPAFLDYIFSLSLH